MKSPPHEIFAECLHICIRIPVQTRDHPEIHHIEIPVVRGSPDSPVPPEGRTVRHDLGGELVRSAGKVVANIPGNDLGKRPAGRQDSVIFPDNDIAFGGKPFRDLIPVVVDRRSQRGAVILADIGAKQNIDIRVQFDFRRNRREEVTVGVHFEVRIGRVDLFGDTVQEVIELGGPEGRMCGIDRAPVRQLERGCAFRTLADTPVVFDFDVDRLNAGRRFLTDVFDDVVRIDIDQVRRVHTDLVFPDAELLRPAAFDDGVERGIVLRNERLEIVAAAEFSAVAVRKIFRGDPPDVIAAVSHGPYRKVLSAAARVLKPAPEGGTGNLQRIGPDNRKVRIPGIDGSVVRMRTRPDEVAVVLEESENPVQRSFWNGSENIDILPGITDCESVPALQFFHVFRIKLFRAGTSKEQLHIGIRRRRGKNFEFMPGNFPYPVLKFLCGIFLRLGRFFRKNDFRSRKGKRTGYPPGRRRQKRRGTVAVIGSQGGDVGTPSGIFFRVACFYAHSLEKLHIADRQDDCFPFRNFRKRVSQRKPVESLRLKSANDIRLVEDVPLENEVAAGQFLQLFSDIRRGPVPLGIQHRKREEGIEPGRRLQTSPERDRIVFAEIHGVNLQKNLVPAFSRKKSHLHRRNFLSVHFHFGGFDPDGSPVSSLGIPCGSAGDGFRIFSGPAPGQK